MDLRYGENPHQAAALYGARGRGIAGAEQLHGKELSYNNLVDLDAAWQLAGEFERARAAIIKHTNPCGCAEQGHSGGGLPQGARMRSGFGVRRRDRPQPRRWTKRPPARSPRRSSRPSPRRIIRRRRWRFCSAKKNLRLMRVAPRTDRLVVKSISGGYLAQTADDAKLDRAAGRGEDPARAHAKRNGRALEFGWKVAKHVKSNAIVYARRGQTVGVGAGQMSRVDSVKLGAMKAVLPLAGTVVASDAFFPFPDGVEEAVKNGATAFIQPGGSVRDGEVIAAADRLGAAMVFTGVRHFRH